MARAAKADLAELRDASRLKDSRPDDRVVAVDLGLRTVGLIRLFNSTDERALWQSYLSLDQVGLSEFSSDNRLTIEYTLMKRAFTNLESPWERIKASEYSLAMGLYKASDRAELTFTDVFSALDEYTKQGTLLLDTAAIDTALTGATTEVACIFEIRITDASGNKHNVYRNTGMTLKEPLITPGSLSVVPGEVAATQSWVRQTCVPRDGRPGGLNPCKEFFMATADNRQVLVRPNAQGEWEVVAF